MIYLINHYPQLQEKLTWLSLGNYPTPVMKLTNLGRFLAGQSIWLKRDDKTSNRFGGNKVRKLELEFAKIIQQNYQGILAYGPIGSNFTAACCLFGNEVGIPVHLVLFKTARTLYVDFNFDISCKNSKSYSVCPSPILLPIHLSMKKIQNRPQKLYLMPPGGSSPLSVFGYINAMFELKDQIDQQLLPVPDYIFLAVGTGGTLAGLLIAKLLLNLSTKIIGIAVVDKLIINRIMVKNLISRTIKLFSNLTGISIKAKDVFKELIIDYNYIGKSYAYPTEKSYHAIQLLKEQENIELDNTYTGKAMAGMLDYIQYKLNPEDQVLFWHSYHAKTNPQISHQ